MTIEPDVTANKGFFWWLSERSALPAARAATLFAILLLLFIGLRPFEDISSIALVEVESGREAATYLAVFTLAAAAFLILPQGSRAALRTLVHPISILIMAWLLLSVAISPDKPASLKRLLLSLTVLSLSAMTPVLFDNVRAFARMLVIVAALVIALCYIGVVLAPDLAMHQFHDPLEPHLAGSWRGFYIHKNTAAAVMALLILCGIFIARAGMMVSGAAICVAAAIFLIFSKGKSSTGLIVFTLLLWFIVAHLSSLWLKLVVVLGPLMLLNFLSVGSVVSDSAKALLQLLPVDATFTGRTDLWEFVLGQIGTRPMLGSGFQAFWYSEIAKGALEKGWAAGASDSHNSYVDLALTVGVPGLVLVAIGFLLLPLIDFHKSMARDENQVLAGFFFSVWLFAIYLACFETFFFARADIIWFMLAMSICGLRYLRFFRVQT